MTKFNTVSEKAVIRTKDAQIVRIWRNSRGDADAVEDYAKGEDTLWIQASRASDGPLLDAKNIPAFIDAVQAVYDDYLYAVEQTKPKNEDILEALPLSSVIEYSGITLVRVMDGWVNVNLTDALKHANDKFEHATVTVKYDASEDK